MKFKTLIFSALIASTSIYVLQAQDAEKSPDYKGIGFFEGSYADALIKSKEENKPIFLDLWATWCAPCKMLKKNTFPDEEVGKYFNDHFINLSLDGEKGEGKELVKKFGIQAYPSLIIIGRSGTPVAYYPGYLKPEGFLEFGETGVEEFSK